MEPSTIQYDVRELLNGIFGKDRRRSRDMIDKFYGTFILLFHLIVSVLMTLFSSNDVLKPLIYLDKECRFENPYLILQGIEEVKNGFDHFVDQSTDISISVKSVLYSFEKQLVGVKLDICFRPKALGGLLPVRISQTLKLQLEYNDPEEPMDKSKLIIVEHQEVHKAEEILSQVPIIGQVYDQPFRTTMGKIALTSGSLMSSTRVMDVVPAAVDTAALAAKYTRSSIFNITSSALNVTRSVCYIIGLSSVIKSAETLATSVYQQVTDMTESTMNQARHIANRARSKTATWVEESKNIEIDCYSTSCAPGFQCYSPTCYRNQRMGGLNAKDMVRAFYSSGTQLTKREE